MRQVMLQKWCAGKCNRDAIGLHREFSYHVVEGEMGRPFAGSQGGRGGQTQVRCEAGCTCDVAVRMRQRLKSKGEFRGNWR